MIITFYNVVFGIACYYGVVAFAFRYLGGLNHIVDPFSFALLIIAAAFFAMAEVSRERGKIFRFISLILPVFALLWNHQLIGMLEFIPPWGYLLYLAFRKPRSLSHYYFMADFSHLLWIFFGMGMFLLFSPDRGIAALYEAAPYLIIFLTAGVFLLQALRHKKGGVGKRFAKNQGGQAAVFFLFCLLMSAGGLMTFLENVLLKKMLLPAGMFLLNHALALVQYLIQRLFRKSGGNSKKDFADYLEYVEKQVQKKPAGPEAERLPVPPETPPMEINYVLVGVVVAVLAAVVIFFLLRSGTKKLVRQSAAVIEREALRPEGKVKRRARRDSGELIRGYYRKFMWVTDGAANRIKPQDTTQKIGERYLKGRKGAESAVEEFTEIYRKQRYRGGEYDAKRMKILLDYLKKM
jgi:hypothetical protein